MFFPHHPTVIQDSSPKHGGFTPRFLVPNMPFHAKMSGPSKMAAHFCCFVHAQRVNEKIATPK